MHVCVCVYRRRGMEREESGGALRTVRQPACMHGSFVCACELASTHTHTHTHIHTEKKDTKTQTKRKA
jgi:hypothetical protein